MEKAIVYKTVDGNTYSSSEEARAHEAYLDDCAEKERLREEVWGRKCAEHKVRLEKEYGVEGHPKADLLFEKALYYAEEESANSSRLRDHFEEDLNSFYEEYVEFIK